MQKPNPTNRTGCIIKNTAKEMKHFKTEDFDSPDEPGSGSRMQKSTLTMIDNACEYSGVAYPISSGFRTPKHNREVNGSETSSHLGGWAVDIETTPTTKARILTGLVKAGFNRIGVAASFVHADNDPTKAPATWKY